MLSPQAMVRGLVSRLLPTRNPDNINQDVGMRLGSYGEQATLSYVRKAHLLAEEGSYYITNNAQTGIATVAAASWAATTPLCIVSNNDSVGGKNIYLDYLKLITTAAGSWASGGVNLQIMIYIDNALRFSSGGSSLTANIVSPNMSLQAATSIASVNFGNLTATAASAKVRCLVGLDILRPAVSATVADVVGELKLINFGAVENCLNGSITVANANQIPHPAPPVIIGPQQSALIYYVMNGTTPSAASYAPELGWWER